MAIKSSSILAKLGGAPIPGCPSFTSNLVTLNLQGKLNANHDIIAHAQPDDFTAGIARREHVRFCSNISLKKSTNSFTRGEREEQYLDKISYFRQVYPGINVLL